MDKFRFFEHFPFRSTSPLKNARFIFTECGKVVDIYISRIDDLPGFVYCFTEAVKVPSIADYRLKVITPGYRYKYLTRVYDVLPPPIPSGEPAQHRKLFLFTLDNYYFDIYSLSTFKHSKYFNAFTVSNSTEAFRNHMFCIYTNMSVASDDLLLYEAMANGCVPVTHRDVPGIHFKVTGRKVLYSVNLNVYVLDVPDLQSFEEAVETAKTMTREEYEDLQAKVKEFVGDTRYEERVNTLKDLINTWQ